MSTYTNSSTHIPSYRPYFPPSALSADSMIALQQSRERIQQLKASLAQRRGNGASHPDGLAPILAPSLASSPPYLLSDLMQHADADLPTRHTIKRSHTLALGDDDDKDEHDNGNDDDGDNDGDDDGVEEDNDYDVVHDEDEDDDEDEDEHDDDDDQRVGLHDVELSPLTFGRIVKRLRSHYGRDASDLPPPPLDSPAPFHPLPPAPALHYDTDLPPPIAEEVDI
eukprot:TRINITY_DN18_c2_g1_i1.p1 TRINITY_DN18_c2_g1~~TRINITY_DN18_c2_g1_i1.p1  ORF type:complete len:235 (+),score=65.29 TRINITY_DN18_c2_g1_i1:36-707(+)